MGILDDLQQFLVEEMIFLAPVDLGVCLREVKGQKLREGRGNGLFLGAVEVVVKNFHGDWPTMFSGLWKAALALLLLLGLPLVGAWGAGKPIAVYLDFPPQPVILDLPGFSWPVFGAYLGAELGICGSLVWLVRRLQRRRTGALAFPVWGWGALVWLAVAWYLAWARPEGMGIWGELSFTWLWLGYIGAVNALCQWRTGECLLTRQPGFLATLFAVSAAFWWYFEYLNRFVGNWHYLGGETLSGWQYFWRASLAFSTVLPAVTSTLALFYGFFGPAEGLPPLSLSHPRRWAWGGVVGAGLGLIGIGAWPESCFALLWLAPLVLLAAVQVLSGQESYFAPLRQGRWEILVLPMLAGLVCGFFWELWNYFSFPKWVYTVPFVSRFKVFEMPILGYAGYLPFGLECALIVDGWRKIWEKRVNCAQINS
ncbi:hypothetical protein JCM13664_06650 [Methylothermus subterraneus]